MLREVRALLYKELLAEYKQQHAIGGLLLYVLSTVFVAALALRGQAPPLVWNVLFWIIILFAALNAVARSFMNERDGQLLYLYQLAHPVSIVLAKLLYNMLLLLVLTFSAYLLYSLLLGSPLQAPEYYWAALVLGAVALASALTLISAIVARAGNKTTLMGVLSLPIIVPQLGTLLRIGQGAVEGIWYARDVLLLCGLSLVAVLLALLLFPYLWRE